MRREINLETYPRRSHFEYFRSLAYPYVGMTANVDVTHVLERGKALGGTAFLSCLWAAMEAANSVPELRQRIVGDGIVEYDHCDTAHTVALEDHTFCNCRTNGRLGLADFLREGRAAHEQAKHHHGFDAAGGDETELIFVSCVPWVAFTQVIQPAPIPADCNPRIVFGKFIRQGERTLMPVSIQANHALVDGWHIGRFFQAMEDINAGLA